MGTAAAWEPALGLLVLAAPLAGVLSLTFGPSPDVPYIDDYDAIVGFLRLHDDTGSLGGRLRTLVEHHNEHMMALPRLAALATRALHGSLDFGWLNALGTCSLLALLWGLYLCFRPGEAVRDKLLPFAPAALLLLHPQFWMMFRSPTTALSGFSVAACAALAFAALDRGRPWRFAVATLLCVAAMATLANGFLIAPLGVVVLAARRRLRPALGWAALSALLLLFYFLVLDPPASRNDPLDSLSQPGRVLRYALNLVGCAAGFSQRGVSLAAGALVLAALLGASGKGLVTRSPALFALVLFLLASVAANALARAPQGPGLPLLQPRYTFYASLLLALAYLSWAEVTRGARAPFAAALLAAGVFCAASFHLYRAEVETLSTRLAEGYERWWTRGDGGLLHPDFRSASSAVLHGLDAGWLRLPPEWLERHAAWPIPRDPPPRDGAVRFRLDAAGQDEQSVYLSGSAQAGSTAGQQVEIVLRNPSGSFVFPASTVARADLADERPAVARSRVDSGFRVLIPKQALPPGPYRLGVLVRRGGREHLSYAARPIEVRPAGVR